MNIDALRSRTQTIPIGSAWVFWGATIVRSFREDPRTCNICDTSSRFQPFGDPPRLSARCPRCGSVERHRLFKLWIDCNRSRLLAKSILHIAPEAGLTQLLRELGSDYVTADIRSGVADTVENVELLSFADRSFDVVICSHVLEHVDDRKALSEFHRILKLGGVCLLMVPIEEGLECTFEDSAVIDPGERRVLFGQSDHVRYYGRDFRTRVNEAGFQLDEFAAIEPYASALGLLRGERVFLANKA